MFKKIHMFRVKPGQELAAEITDYCVRHGITSGVVIGIIGSVESARLNFLRELPGKYESVQYEGPLEVVCAQGSVALKGSDLITHVHIQLSGRDQCRGGHLAQAMVFSTAEVAIGELDYQLVRYADSSASMSWGFSQTRLDQIRDRGPESSACHRTPATLERTWRSGSGIDTRTRPRCRISRGLSWNAGATY